MATLNTDMLDIRISDLLAAARIPGAAISIVSDGEVIFSNAYGRRDDLGNKLTVNTLYPIASTTKAMNATVIGMLVDQGVLDWDEPVVSYLPNFALGDPVRSSQVTLRDLVTMRTGLPRHDWLWWGNPVSRTDQVQRLKYLELTGDFRARFQYNNLTATLAGHVAEIVTGQSWETLMLKMLMQPLGMSETVFARPETGDVTQSWMADRHGGLTLVQPIPAEHIGPAGGAIYSTVSDMSRWVAFNLAGGVSADGQRLIEPTTFHDIHRGHMVMDEWPEYSRSATYGLGWMIDPYNGHERIFHPGDWNEVNSEVALFPNAQLGTVCFTNFGAVAMASLINQLCFDTMKDLAPVSSVAERLRSHEVQAQEREDALTSAARVAGTRPSHAIPDYAGSYVHPGYGQIVIEQTNDKLVMERGMFRLRMDHWHFDSWVVIDGDRLGIDRQHPFEWSNRWNFETNADGMISALNAVFEPSAKPIRFHKQPV
jgi:CubicO group peptidase (beta-lactamase class C family)